MDEKSEYDKAYREIELFDEMVMDTLTTQRSISVPFHHLENKEVAVPKRMAVTLFSLNAQIAELISLGVNPSKIIRGYIRSIQDAYIHASNNKEVMGIPAVKRDQAIKNIEDSIVALCNNPTLEEDLKSIV